MSQMMRAVEITSPGGPDVLQLTERPVPEPGHGQVVIKVAWAGVNRPDALQRAGLYAPPPTARRSAGAGGLRRRGGHRRGCVRGEAGGSGLRPFAGRRLRGVCRNPGGTLSAGSRWIGAYGSGPACRRHISPCGQMSLPAVGCKPGNGSWSMADPPASEPRPSSWRMRLAQGSLQRLGPRINAMPVPPWVRRLRLTTDHRISLRWCATKVAPISFWIWSGANIFRATSKPWPMMVGWCRSPFWAGRR